MNKVWIFSGHSLSKFLNRLLGLPVHAQNALFDYFTAIVNELVAQAKFDGTYDMGIMGELEDASLLFRADFPNVLFEWVVFYVKRPEFIAASIFH